MSVVYALNWHMNCIKICNADVQLKIIYGIFIFNAKAMQQTASIFKINYM